MYTWEHCILYKTKHCESHVDSKHCTEQPTYILTQKSAAFYEKRVQEVKYDVSVVVTGRVDDADERFEEAADLALDARILQLPLEVGLLDHRLEALVKRQQYLQEHILGNVSFTCKSTYWETLASLARAHTGKR